MSATSDAWDAMNGSYGAASATQLLLTVSAATLPLASSLLEPVYTSWAVVVATKATSTAIITFTPARIGWVFGCGLQLF